MTGRDDMDAGPLLDIRDLTLSFRTGGGLVRALNGVNLTVGHRERVGIVGESGSGKSVTAQAVLGLVPAAEVTGEIRFAGENLLAVPQERMRQVRGKEIGYIFQDPLSALDPVRSIGDQISETLRIRGVRKAEAMRRSIDLLGRVGVKNAKERARDYPHQFSGGMRQRVMIAMALVAEPRLVIADEPTTALDVRVQAQVLDLLLELAEERGLSVLFITHDLGVLSGFAERVVVMYAGRAMEQCVTDELFYGSINPYTLGLLESLPRIDGEVPRRLTTIGGQPPSPPTRRRAARSTPAAGTPSTSAPRGCQPC
ncbi:ABC transporter ATP-binding protein [Phytohabitans flavus]|uniref:ABC transporter ATP-binding protein n=1 Tax=Phytohabitans flavus TaxID=1076124 RepID=UPI0036364600